MTPKQIDENEYYNASENLIGWCTTCQAFTTDMVEPDARGYKCEVCEKKTVYGAEEALIQGLITF